MCEECPRNRELDRDKARDTIRVGGCVCDWLEEDVEPSKALTHFEGKGDGVIWPVYAGPVDHIHHLIVEHVEDVNHGFFRFPLSQISIVPEGEEGWILPIRHPPPLSEHRGVYAPPPDLPRSLQGLDFHHHQ